MSQVHSIQRLSRLLRSHQSVSKVCGVAPRATLAATRSFRASYYVRWSDPDPKPTPGHKQCASPALRVAVNIFFTPAN